jgi:molecular chaperone HscB
MTGSGATDLFAVLGLPRRYDVAPSELERRFHERSRAVHPDRFARATPAERRASLERTTRLNQAYRTLRDPWRRAEHLVELLGGAADGAGTEVPDAAFLEEQLEAREELAGARRRRDGGSIEALRRRAAEALAALERELARVLAGVEPSEGALREARRLLRRVCYHQALLDEAERALDPHASRKGTTT